MGLLFSQRHYCRPGRGIAPKIAQNAGWTLVEQFSAATPLDETVLLGLIALGVPNATHQLKLEKIQAG